MAEKTNATTSENLKEGKDPHETKRRKEKKRRGEQKANTTKATTNENADRPRIRTKPVVILPCPVVS